MLKLSVSAAFNSSCFIPDWSFLIATWPQCCSVKTPKHSVIASFDQRTLAYASVIQERSYLFARISHSLCLSIVHHKNCPSFPVHDEFPLRKLLSLLNPFSLFGNLQKSIPGQFSSNSFPFQLLLKQITTVHLATPSAITYFMSANPITCRPK